MKCSLPAFDDPNGTDELLFNWYNPVEEVCDGLHGECRDVLYELTLAIKARNFV